MITLSSFRHKFYWAILSTILACGPSFAAAQDGPEIRRYDPKSDELIEVKPDQVVAGKIYNHFSQTYGRYVWAFAKEEGGFSYPLGPGTTELPGNFDLAASKREVDELLRREAAEWFGESRRERRQIMVRLGANGQWEVLKFRCIRSHFDPETGRRWEWHGTNKVVVRHTFGYLWRYDGTWYEPLRSSLSLGRNQFHRSTTCSCAMCTRGW